MQINIDPKINKLCKRSVGVIPEKKQLRHCVHEIARNITEDRDCLLVTTPASLKTQILFAIASINPCHQKKMRIVIPENRPYLFFANSSNHICIQSFETYLKDSNKQCAAVLVDEGERIDDPVDGERLELLLIESDPDSSLVLAINARSNVDDVANWLSKIRNRKCMLIHAQSPKTIEPTYFTHTGEWLPLLNKKKLNQKVKKHLKTIKTPVSMKKIYFQCVDLVYSQKLLPALFVLPDISTAIDLWNKHPEKESVPGQYMTAPQVVQIISDYPKLKDNPFVLKMLKMRAGICFNDQVWLQLLEQFYSLGAFDEIFATPETIKRLYCSGKSLILMGHPKHHSKNKDISLALWYDQLLMRSGYNDNFWDDIKQQTAFCIVTDSPEVSPVHVKDYLNPGSFSLQSHFKWSIHNILERAARNRTALDDLHKSFLVASQGKHNNVLFHDVIMEIQAEFPHARCLPVNAMVFLNSIRIKWTSELVEKNKQLGSNSNQCLETKYQKTKFLLDCLPCNACDHESTCHQRGSKRFRELVDRFNAYQADRANEHLLLEITAPFFSGMLQQLGWINFRNDITPKGQLAYQLGSIVNPLLFECFFNNMIPMENHRLCAAIIAGFLPDEWAFPSNIDFRYPAISAIYQEFWPHLKVPTKKMLALGIHPHIPDYQLSCLYYSLTSTDDQLKFMEQTKLNQMTVNSFIDRVDHIAVRLRSKITQMP